MSSNTQINVSLRQRVSLEALGPGSAARLRGVLERIVGGNKPDLAAVCQTAWRAVDGQSQVFSTMVQGYEVAIDLSTNVPTLRIAGRQRIMRNQEVPEVIVRGAHRAVNQVLAVAVAERIATRLTNYAEQRIRQTTGAEVTQSVALKALQMQRGQQALRVSCRISASA